MPKSLTADLKELMQSHDIYDEKRFRKCLRLIRPKRQVSSSHPYRVFQELIKSDLHARIPMEGDSKEVFGKRSKLASLAYQAYKNAGNEYTDEVKQIIKEG